MKKTYFLSVFILVTAILFVGCGNSAKHKAEELIKQKLQSEAGYEPIKFGTLDSTHTIPTDTPTSKAIIDKADEYTLKAQQAVNARESYANIKDAWAVSRRNMLLNEAKHYLDSVEMYQPLIDSINKAFVPQFTGWVMGHSYRTKGVAEGNFHLVRFFFDKELSQITGNEDTASIE